MLFDHTKCGQISSEKFSQSLFSRERSEHKDLEVGAGA